MTIYARTGAIAASGAESKIQRFYADSRITYGSGHSGKDVLNWQGTKGDSFTNFSAAPWQVDNVVNGKSVLRFDGNEAMLMNRSFGNKLTFFCVAAYTQTSTPTNTIQILFGNDNTSHSPNTQWVLRWGNGYASTAYDLTPETFSGNYSQFALRVNGANTTRFAGNFGQFYVITLSVDAVLTSFTDFSLGTYTTSGSNRSKMDLAYLGIADDLLSLSEKQAEESKLAAEFDLTF